MIDALHPDTVAKPPRHHADGELCVRALITEDCGLSHDYDHGKPMTPIERRMVELEVMIEELALLDPASGAEAAGYMYEVDELVRNDDGRITAVYGTRSRFVHEPITNDGRVMHPYILGEV